MKVRFLLVSLAWVFLLDLHAGDLFKIPDNAAQELSPGVPHTVDTNGELVSIDFMFTTPAYQEAAFRLVVQEANQVALDMGLKENRPIAENNIVHAFIAPFGYAFTETAIGNIKTTNYWYFIKRGNKFSDVSVANYDEYYVKYRDKKFSVPFRAMNTNAAYQLASQWLAAAKMDVAGLNRDCELHINLSTEMLPDDEKSAKRKKPSRITPVYFVSWLPKLKTEDYPGSVAYVELYLPTKQLLQLSVNDPKYILRPPLVFTNLAALFPGRATITTNKPSKVIVIDGSKWPTDNNYVSPENAK